MAIEQRIEPIVVDVVADLGLEVYDVEFNGGVLRISLDLPGGGVDLDQLADANKAIGAALDAADPIPDRYQLEVSSPGVERRLRRADHWRAAIGEDVNVKLFPGVGGDRRVRGRVAAVDASGVTLASDDETERTLAFADIARATTVFTWTAGAGPFKDADDLEPPQTTLGATTDAVTSPDPKDESE